MNEVCFKSPRTILTLEGLYYKKSFMKFCSGSSLLNLIYFKFNVSKEKAIVGCGPEVCIHSVLLLLSPPG